MFNYQAPNPYPKVFSRITTSIYNLLSHLIPPSISSLKKQISPTQSDPSKAISPEYLLHIQNRYHLHLDRGIVTTHDKAGLDTIQFTPDNTRGRLNCYIIKFIDNGNGFENFIHDFITEAKSLNAVVIGFNYRGVGNSAPVPQRYSDWITDGIAQVQRLLDDGIPSTKILLDGHALGGGIATLVAQYYHEKGQPIYLWNDRSFAILNNPIAGIISPTATTTNLDAPQIFSDVAKAYSTIPTNYKGYLFVSKKAAAGRGDGIIAHADSLHRAVKTQELSTNEVTAYKVTTQSQQQAHNLSRHHLFSHFAHTKNGQMIYEDFVRSHLNSV